MCISGLSTVCECETKVLRSQPRNGIFVQKALHHLVISLNPKP